MFKVLFILAGTLFIVILWPRTTVDIKANDINANNRIVIYISLLMAWYYAPILLTSVAQGMAGCRVSSYKHIISGTVQEKIVKHG